MSRCNGNEMEKFANTLGKILESLCTHKDLHTHEIFLKNL